MGYCKKYQSIKFERWNWVSLWSFPLVSSLGPPSDFLGSQYWPPSWSVFPEAPNTPSWPQLTSLRAHVTSPGPMGPTWGPISPTWGPMWPPWSPISPRSLWHLPISPPCCLKGLPEVTKDLSEASRDLYEVLTDLHKVSNGGRPQVISSKPHKNYISPKATL